jgi:transposase
LVESKKNREISRVLNISKSTVANYIARSEVGQLISHEQIKKLTDEDLKKVIFPSKSGPKEISVDFNYIQKELKRKYVTLQIL